jgi:undecaprenyl diphosphate synthase
MDLRTTRRAISAREATSRSHLDRYAQKMGDHDTTDAVASKNGARRPAQHVALIIDGNRRWAHSQGLSVAEGHEAGADTVIARVLDAADLGVRELVVYLFSTENWSRAPDEVEGLMALLARRIPVDTLALHERGVRIRFTGRRDDLSSQLVTQMEWAEALTQNNRVMTLFLAVNYGGRAEIIDAARGFSEGQEANFRAHLYTPEMHDPDLVIRTGGERRLSNFLLWQSAYAELLFRDELWPEFTRESLEDSLDEFARRERRFGGRARAEAR